MTEERVKVVLVGSAGVGKTCLIHRWISDRFNAYQPPTVACGVQSVPISIDGVSYTIEVFDTAGQEQFATLTPQYVRGAQGALIVFSMTEPESLRDVPKWKELVENASSSPVPIVIAANKADLPSQVSDDDISQIIGDLTYFQTSAENGSYVDDAFAALVDAAVTNRRRSSAALEVQEIPEEPAARVVDIAKKPSAKRKAKCC
jgi:small GTP-binding protein